MYEKWARYVSAGERQRKAADALSKLTKKGHAASPVVIRGRAIATTAWGKAWCANMERYSDYANRLPRGRSYVRNGSVVDLQITPGEVRAKVSGSSIYNTSITVKPVPQARWQQLCADCGGGIDSLVELLQGQFPREIMDRLCRQGDGLFPMTQDIRFDCSCPDGASMCKHVAAVLYGIGARLDSAPELLFSLRQIDPVDLLKRAGDNVANAAQAGERTLAGDDIGALFGLEMDVTTEAAPTTAKRPEAVPKPARAAAASAKPPRRKAQPVRVREPISRLLAALHREGSLDNAAARAATGLDAEAVRRLLRQLVADGHAQVQGQRRGTRYVALRKGQQA